jgi:hypothetical protein
MYLSRRSKGIYYLWFEDDRGNKRKISTGCTSKSEAIKFLRSFKPEDHQKEPDRITLSQFAKIFLVFSSITHARSTQECSRFPFKEPEKSVGHVSLSKISFRLNDWVAASALSSHKSINAFRGVFPKSKKTLFAFCP